MAVAYSTATIAPFFCSGNPIFVNTHRYQRVRVEMSQQTRALKLYCEIQGGLSGVYHLHQHCVNSVDKVLNVMDIIEKSSTLQL